MHSLPVFLRLTGQPVILVGQGDAAEAKRRLLERAGAIVCGEASDGRIAIVAEEDDEIAIAAIDRLKMRGILVNATDRPDYCDFTLPAVLDRDPVLIAIGTGGASAGLAKALRQRLEAAWPPTLGTLATALAAARSRIRKKWPDAADRRRAIDAALSPSGTLDPSKPFADEALDNWLEGAHENAVPVLHRIILTSDDPDDLTLAQARWLGGADLIIHWRVPPAILDRARADSVRQEGQVAPSPLPAGLTVLISAAI